MTLLTEFTVESAALAWRSELGMARALRNCRLGDVRRRA